MPKLEQDSNLTNTSLFLGSRLGTKESSNQTSIAISEAIQNNPATKTPKAWIPKSYCQYPSPPKMDDFDISRGLGHVSLAGAIDQINQFKQTCIESIKTKLQSMGPDGSRDAKLAMGITKTIQQVYQAAKCFTQMVQNINMVITTYVSVLDVIIVEVYNQVQLLESQIGDIQRMLDPVKLEVELIGVIEMEVLAEINAATGIFELLNALNKLFNQLAKLQTALTTLGNSPERVMLHLESQMMLLKGMIRQFEYLLSLWGILKSNRAYAAPLKMLDDFLDDFNYTPTDSGDYSWSVTNSGFLINYNPEDSQHILSKLTSSSRDYINSENAQRIVIDSRVVSGTIVVSGDGDGIISGGLDNRCDNSFGYMFELSINNGKTVIQAFLQGNTTSSDLVNPVIGKIYVDAQTNFSYSKAIDNGDGTFKLFFSDSAEYKHVEIGDWYKVGEIAPDDTEGYPGSTSLPLVPYSTWFNTTNGYQTTFGAVEGQAGFTYGYEHEFLDPTIVAGLPPNQFISGTLHDCIPIPGGGWSMKVFSNNDLTTPKFYPMAFKVIDVNTMFATVELLVPNSTLSLTDLISGADNTYSFGAFPNASLTPQSKPPIDPSEKSIFTMAKYSLQQSPGIPQTGQKIPCDNWTLSIVPVGIRDPYKLNATRFVQLRPGEIMRSIFLKCKFGFIPDAE